MQNQPKSPLRDRWLAALRSGAYKQHHGEWGGETTGYCAFGVLIMEHNGDIAYFRTRSLTVVMDLVYPDWPGQKQREIGGRIIDLNDDQKLPFPQIADWIEQADAGYEPHGGHFADPIRTALPCDDVAQR